MAVSAVFLGLVRPAKRGLLCRRRNSKHPENIHERTENSVEQSAVCEQNKRTESPQDCSEVDDNLACNQVDATRDSEEVISFAWADNDRVRVIKESSLMKVKGYLRTTAGKCKSVMSTMKTKTNNKCWVYMICHCRSELWEQDLLDHNMYVPMLPYITCILNIVF